MFKDKLIYVRNEDTSHGEASKIEMEIPEDLTISEYRIVCMRMAAALGYHPNSIKRAFGEEDQEELSSFNEEFDKIMGGLFGKE